MNTTGLTRRLVTIIIGCALFGVIMGFRLEVKTFWSKVAVSAVAGAVLGMTLYLAHRQVHEH